MTTDTITVDIDGKTYAAERTVTGITKIRQSLRFSDGHVDHDSETYTPDDEAKMLANARHIIWQRYGSSWENPSR
jgi:hypothetical protein